MKITKQRLKEIITEELAAALSETAQEPLNEEVPEKKLIHKPKYIDFSHPYWSQSAEERAAADAEAEELEAKRSREKKLKAKSGEDEEARRSRERRLNARDGARPKDDWRKHNYTRHSAGRGQHNYAQSSRYGGGGGFAEGKTKKKKTTK